MDIFSICIYGFAYMNKLQNHSIIWALWFVREWQHSTLLLSASVPRDWSTIAAAGSTFPKQIHHWID